MRKNKDVKPKILIFDAEYEGHHIEFVVFLLRYIAENGEKLPFEPVFLLHAAMKPHLERRVPTANVHYLEQMQVWESTKNWREHRRTLAAVKQWAMEEGCQKILFMRIDPYLLPLGLVSLKPLSIAGILFMPYPRNLIKTWKRPLQKTWAWFKILLACLCNNVQHVGILNDRKSVSKLNRNFFLRTRFFEIPDPVDDFLLDTPLLEENLKNKKERKKLLIFGHITERKNISNILKALSLLHHREQEKIELKIIGKGNEAYFEEIKQKIENIKKENPKILVDCQNAFLTYEAMHRLFANSDAMLLLYRNLYISSGILGHAARYRKPVVATHRGVLSELTEAYQLGFTTDPDDVQGIAKAIQKLIHEGFKMEDSEAERYVEERTPTAFAATLLGCFSV